MEHSILTHLAEDCTISQVTLGKKLGISRQTIASKISTLEKENIIQGYSTIIDPRAFGKKIFAITSASTQQRPLNTLIKQIKALDEVYILNITTGANNIQVFSYHDSTDSLYKFIDSKLGSIEHLHDIDTKVSLKSYLKPGFVSNTVVRYPKKRTISITELEHQILTRLMTKARMSISEIARVLSASNRTIKTHLDSLKTRGVILFPRLEINPNELGYKALANVEIKISKINIRKSVRSLLQFKSVRYINEILGPYDLNVVVFENNINKLRKFVQEDLRETPGFKESNTSLILKRFQLQQ